MEKNATSSSHSNQQATDSRKSGQKDGENAQQQNVADQPQPNVQKTSIGKRMKRFMWNPETREFMGRTSKSWGQILFFYFCFYSFLAGFFAACLYVMMLTLNPYTPKYRDRVAPPGLMTRPYLEESLMCLNLSKRGKWQKYVNDLNSFLQAYDDAVQTDYNLNCTPGQYFIQDTAETIPKQACQFKRSLLGDCSGLNDSTYGYSVGEPCVLLKMNRIIGYKPGYGSPVTVSCHPYKDEEHPPDLTFSPYPMFDLMYYPYYGKFTHINYVSPLVAVKFRNVTRNVEVVTQCQLNGVGIVNNFLPDKYLGRVIIRIVIGP